MPENIIGEVGSNLLESSQMRVIIGPFHVTVTSGMVQRLHKIIHCVRDHNYEPYSKPQPGSFLLFVCYVVSIRIISRFSVNYRKLRCSSN